MKRLIMVIGLLSALGLASAVTVSAGDNLTLSMSCSIPAIPGVNAPLIEEETVKTSSDTPVHSTPEPQEETLPEPLLIIQQDTQEEQAGSQAEESLVIVRTIYSR